VQAASLRSAGIRNPQQQRSFHNRCFRELSLGNTGFDNRWLAK
jgi:hypothetical protein